jgi:hypothetical protein
LLNEVVFSGQGELTPHIGIMVKTPKPMGFWLRFLPWSQCGGQLALALDSHLIAVSVLVLWLGLEKSKITKLVYEK